MDVGELRAAREVKHQRLECDQRSEAVQRVHVGELRAAAEMQRQGLERSLARLRSSSTTDRLRYKIL